MASTTATKSGAPLGTRGGDAAAAVECGRRKQAPISTMNAITVITATAAACGASTGTSTPTASPITMEIAATVALVESQSLQPMTKPGYGPNAYRAKTYCPP